jgi:hypothetical protein
VTLLFVAGFAAVAAGCGGSGDNTSTTTLPSRPPGVKFATANKVGTGDPRTEVIHRLGDPVLTSKAVQGAPGGCLYFAMYQRPLSDVWRFCLDEHDKVNSGATLYSFQQPPPPQDASVARKVLIARADGICDYTSKKTSQPEKLARRVKQVTASSSPAARRKLAALMRAFSESAETSRGQLKRFNAPPDALSELEAYESALHDQAVALDRAAKALSAGDEMRYQQELDRVRRLGDAATTSARQYGFSTCAGVKVS